MCVYGGVWGVRAQWHQLTLICPFLYFVIETALFKHFCYVSRFFVWYHTLMAYSKKKRLKISSNSIWLLMTLTIRISPTEWENGVEWTQRDYYRGYNPHCVTLLLFSAAKNARHRKKEHSEVSDRVYSETSVVRILKIHEKQSVGRHSQKQ